MLVLGVAFAGLAVVEQRLGAAANDEEQLAQSPLLSLPWGLRWLVPGSSNARRFVMRRDGYRRPDPTLRIIRLFARAGAVLFGALSVICVFVSVVLYTSR